MGSTITKYKKDNFLNEKFFAFDMVIVEPILRLTYRYLKTDCIFR